MYSTITVQKNSGSQWSGNFSQPPSAIENKGLSNIKSETMTKIHRVKVNTASKLSKWALDNKINKCQVQLMECSTSNNKHLETETYWVDQPTQVCRVDPNYQQDQSTLDTNYLHTDWLRDLRIYEY